MMMRIEYVSQARRLQETRPSETLGLVGCTSEYSFIGGGSQNCIDTNVHHGSCYNIIGGGLCNIISTNTCFSSIIGGACNTVNHNYATVAGCNITTGSDCAFHANCLIAPNTPTTPVGALAPGTIIRLAAGGIPPVGALALYMMP